MTASSHVDEIRRATRARMVIEQLVARGIADDRVLAAMAEVPREAFVAEPVKSRAYDDAPQTIGCGQTISQPYIVARMLELAEVQPHDRALEVGTGTGYQAAVLGRLAARVTTIERIESLGLAARENLAAIGATNVEVHIGDGTLGVPACAPYDVIVIAAGGPEVPTALLAQLAPGGRLVGPFGDRFTQVLERVTRRRDATGFDRERFDPVVFVPLVGAQGWQS